MGIFEFRVSSFDWGLGGRDVGDGFWCFLLVEGGAGVERPAATESAGLAGLGVGWRVGDSVRGHWKRMR